MKSDFRAFGRALADKWQATCQRNLSSTVSGPNGLWKQAIILDPFLKSVQPQLIDNYTQLFGLVTDISSIKDEFTMYLREPVPDNPDLTAMQYWSNVKQLYPQLSQAALELLSISTESVDVERSFSKLRKLQHPTRSSVC
uniref:HAT C-terminal dimerisation domain-containing protein n=1 Tax=Amphimedon queenslandica TaxID=400682 RepID=A0A1X7TEF6_AMPQE